MRTVDLIERKRAGEELSRAEIQYLVMGYVKGEIPDYQMSAWLMAVCCRGMSRQETLDLTEIMATSGATLDLSRVAGPVADKHSSGGVGDKTTLVVAPLVRACGVPVGKMSGRGLGFTGGTLDKLESIPGMRVELSSAQFVRQLESEGIVICGQTADVAPADGKLYALRDVTGTVSSVPLIASSIMSKKLAVGAHALVLDVKVGVGALMGGVAEARALAELMVDIGKLSGKRVSAFLTPMDEPLGHAVGNVLEVEEAIRTLRGEGPRDLVELSTLLAGEMLFLAGRVGSPQEGKTLASEVLSSGKALEQLERLLVAQGGDPHVIEDPGIMGRAPLTRVASADRAGWVSEVNARRIAEAALLLGAGRARKGDPIDRRVGIVLRAKAGVYVQRGEPLAEVHARDAESAESAIKQVIGAYTIGDERPAAGPPLIERHTGEPER